MGNEFIQLTGEDGNALEFNKRGGVGMYFSNSKYCSKTLFRLCKNFLNQIQIMN